MKVYKVCIAGIHILVKSIYEIEISNAFRKFMVDDFASKEKPYEVILKETEKIEFPEKGDFFEEARAIICRTEEGIFFRGFRNSDVDKNFYAYNRCDFEKKQIKVICLKGAEQYFRDMRSVFNHISWENILLHENKLMLHASYVETSFGGIAFSGPSGIGKSTQGNLWIEYGNGRLINGDKLVLSRDEKWNGYGSPYAGSSGCYVNDFCEMKAIFFLKQGKMCSLQRLNTAESFKRIYSGLTLNRWAEEYVEKACGLAFLLAQEVPAYEFICTPDKQAVDFLIENLF